VVQIILDGHHMADETAALVWRVAGGRVAVVSDAMAAAGNGDGRFVLGGTRVDVVDGIARNADGALAGSVGTMIEAVRVLAARGSSDNAARYAQYLFGAVNRLPVALATPSLYTLYRTPPRLESALVIGISQSGASPDIAAVVSEARAQGCPTIAITNDPT